MENKCYTCGSQMNPTEKELALRFKADYENNGVVRYFFKRTENSKTEFARKETFKEIKKILDKNKAKGSNYAHISEFKAD